MPRPHPPVPPPPGVDGTGKHARLTPPSFAVSRTPFELALRKVRNTLGPRQRQKLKFQGELAALARPTGEIEPSEASD